MSKIRDSSSVLPLRVCCDTCLQCGGCFCVLSCSLTSDDVRRLYWKGGAEASESTDIVFLSQQVSGLLGGCVNLSFRVLKKQKIETQALFYTH